MKIFPAFICTILLVCQEGLCQSQPAAITCIENFLTAFGRITSYSGTLNKVEYTFSGQERRRDLLEIYQETPLYTRVTYLTQGSTGIKNNGMIAEYDGSNLLKVKLGKSSGLGFLVNIPASLVVGNTLPIDGTHAMEDEYFTLNRAGLIPLAAILRTQLPSLKTTTQGGVTVNPGTCKVHYTKHSNEIVSRTLQSKDSIFDLENEFGTLAFLILQFNKGQFSDLYDLFHRKKTHEIKIPKWFFDFDLEFDSATHLPTEIVFYLNSRALARYGYAIKETH